MISLKKINLNVTDRAGRHIMILKDIEFEIASKEFVLLLGPSGSGKSSLLSIIAGLVRPTSGRVEIDGKSISQIPDQFSAAMRRERIGFIFQKFNLIPDLSVVDNITLPLYPTDLTREAITERVNPLLASLELSDMADQQVNLLSGGEQQRVAIARALINKPDIILADEPTANLDEDLFQEFLSILDRLKSLGVTLILSSHDQRFSELDLFQSVYHLKKGVLSHP